MKTTLISYLIALGIVILGAGALSSCGDMGDHSSNANNNMRNPKSQLSMPDKQMTNHN